MSENIEKILKEITEDLKNLFKEKLKYVYLYGSYSRGENEKDSDVDIFVLLDLTFDEIRKYDDSVSKISSDYCIKYDLYFSIFTKELNTFIKYKSILPFYQNVVSEGKNLYAGRD